MCEAGRVFDLTISMRDGGLGRACASVLEGLPEWFGIPEANADYVEAADRELGVVAINLEGVVVGLCTLVRHSPAAAEVHLLAVGRPWHRRGVGRALLEVAEAHLAADGVRFLQVKTLSSASADENYARTRRFYEGVGFVVLEEFPELWDPSNPAVQMIKAVSG